MQSLNLQEVVKIAIFSTFFDTVGLQESLNALLGLDHDELGLTQITVEPDCSIGRGANSCRLVRVSHCVTFDFKSVVLL